MLSSSSSSSISFQTDYHEPQYVFNSRLNAGRIEAQLQHDAGTYVPNLLVTTATGQCLAFQTKAIYIYRSSIVVEHCRLGEKNYRNYVDDLQNFVPTAIFVEDELKPIQTVLLKFPVVSGGGGGGGDSSGPDSNCSEEIDTLIQNAFAARSPNISSITLQSIFQHDDHDAATSLQHQSSSKELHIEYSSQPIRIMSDLSSLNDDDGSSSTTTTNNEWVVSFPSMAKLIEPYSSGSTSAGTTAAAAAAKPAATVTAATATAAVTTAAKAAAAAAATAADTAAGTAAGTSATTTSANNESTTPSIIVIEQKGAAAPKPSSPDWVGVLIILITVLLIFAIIIICGVLLNPMSATASTTLPSEKNAKYLNSVLFVSLICFAFFIGTGLSDDNTNNNNNSHARTQCFFGIGFGISLLCSIVTSIILYKSNMSAFLDNLKVYLGKYWLILATLAAALATCESVHSLQQSVKTYVEIGVSIGTLIFITLLITSSPPPLSSSQPSPSRR